MKLPRLQRAMFQIFLLFQVGNLLYGQSENRFDEDLLHENIETASKIILRLNNSSLDYYNCLEIEAKENVFGTDNVIELAIVWKKKNSKFISFIQGDMYYDNEMCNFRLKIQNSSMDVASLQYRASEINICNKNTNLMEYKPSKELNPKGSMGTGKGFKKKSIHSDGY